MAQKSNEFVRLLTAAGWSQAEAARRLQITPGAVSQICSGRTQPRSATLNLFKLLIGKDNPKALAEHESSEWQALAPWEKELLQNLRPLQEKERERLLGAVRQMLAWRGKG